MAVSGSRKRSTDWGGYQYGRRILLSDGTYAFQPLTAISDALGNAVSVNKSALVMYSEDVDSIKESLDGIRAELRLTNELLKGILQ